MSAITSYLAGAGRWLLETEVHVALLVVLVALLQTALGARLAPRWRHALWLVVALRMALPVLPPAPFGAPRLLAAPDRVAPAASPAPIIERPTWPGPLPFPAGTAAEEPNATSFTSGVLASSLEVPTVLKPPPPTEPRWAAILGAVWLLGCLILLAARTAAGFRLRSIMREARPVDDPILLKALTDAALEIGIRSPPLFLSPRISAPGLAGAIRPRILFPADLPGKLSAADLRSILLHELAHARRRDTATELLASVLAAVHWMNPLAWWSLRRLREERELACDEEVLRRAREIDPLEYAGTVLRVARSASRHGALPMPLGAGIHSGPRLLEKRIRRVSAFDPRRRPGSRLALVLLPICAALGLTGAPAADQTRPLVTREYPVEKLIQPHQDFEPPPLGLVKMEAGKQPEGPPRGELESARTLEELVVLIRSSVFPRTPIEGLRIVAEGSSLRITAPEEVHLEVERLLLRLTIEKGLMVKIEAKVFALDEAALKTLPPDLSRDLRVSAFRGSTLSVSSENLETLMRAGDRGKGERNTLWMTAFNHQRAHSLVVQQAAMVVDVRAPEEPLTGILNTGLVVEARPIVSEDRHLIILELGFEKCDVSRPILTKDVFGVKVSMPELSRHKFHKSMGLSPGDWAVAGVGSPSKLDGLLTVVLVRASIVEPEKSEK